MNIQKPSHLPVAPAFLKGEDRSNCGIPIFVLQKFSEEQELAKMNSPPIMIDEVKQSHVYLIETIASIAICRWKIVVEL